MTLCFVFLTSLIVDSKGVFDTENDSVMDGNFAAVVMTMLGVYCKSFRCSKDPANVIDPNQDLRDKFKSCDSC